MDFNENIFFEIFQKKVEYMGLEIVKLHTRKNWLKTQLISNLQNYNNFLFAIKGYNYYRLKK